MCTILYHHAPSIILATKGLSYFIGAFRPRVPKRCDIKWHVAKYTASRKGKKDDAVCDGFNDFGDTFSLTAGHQTHQQT